MKKNIKTYKSDSDTDEEEIQKENTKHGPEVPDDPEGAKDALAPGQFYNREAALAAVADIELQPFDFDKLALDSSVFVFGKRRYGKTTFGEYLLSFVAPYYRRGGYVFTQTKQNYFWQAHFPENRVYEGIPEEVLQSIITQQKAIYNAIMEGADIDILPHIVLIFDDVISAGELRQSKILEKVIYNGRHYFLFCLICSQDVKGIGPALRQNGDLVALTYQTQERSVESIRDDYAYFFGNKYAFNYLLTKNTKDFQLMLIDQTEAKYKVEDTFFVAKAPDPKTDRPVYRIGDDFFWKRARNDWKKQLARTKLVPCSGRQDWEKLVPDCKVVDVAEEDSDKKKHEGMKMVQDSEKPHFKLEDVKLSKISQNHNAIPTAESFYTTENPNPSQSEWDLASRGMMELLDDVNEKMSWYKPVGNLNLPRRNPLPSTIQNAIPRYHRIG